MVPCSRIFLVTVLSLAMITNANNLTTSFLQKLNDLQNVHRRQLDGNIPLSAFPQQCLPECAPALTAHNGCKRALCLCTPTVDRSLAECLDCVVNAEGLNAEGLKNVSQVADVYNAICDGLGLLSISILSPSGIINATSSQTLSGNNAAITRSVGTATASANIGYLSFTAVVTLAMLVA